jgi:PAS domain S-box-containing protein
MSDHDSARPPRHELDAEIAARRTAEAERATLAAIVESSDDAIVGKTLLGVILSWNAGAQKLYGYTAEEMIGQTIYQLIPPERHHEEEQILSRLRNGQRVSGLETVRIAKSGRRLDVSLTVSPIRDSQGRIIGASKIARDISYRKQAEQRLRESQQRLVGIISSATDAIITVDHDQNITLFNAAAERMFGCSAADAVGKPLDQFIPHRFRTVHREHVRRFSETGVTARAMGAQRPLAALRSDGTEFPVEATISQIDVAGQKLYTAIVRDISERQRQEEALLESEGRLRAIVETAVDGIITIDARGLIGSFNPAAERIFGYAPDEVIGQNVKMLMPAPYQQEHDQYLVDYQQTGIKKIIGVGREVFGRRKDGSTFPMDLAVSETKLNDRIIFTGIVRDITERKRGEQEREQLLALERTARSEAERANRMKDEFLATLSHELRTPLNAIYGWAQLLQTRSLADEEIVQGLDVIARNARLQTQLVEDLLDMSRIISGKLNLDLQRVDLSEIIDAAVQSAIPAAQAKSIRLHKIVDPMTGQVVGDAARIQQVVWNLLSNAVKFTPKGGRVQVFLERVQSHVEISVTDTGVGITPDFLPHLFQRFRQADSSTTRRYGGLGLGLAIVKHLVELHGGTVKVKSDGLNQGSTFTICLPIRPVIEGSPLSQPSQPRRLLRQGLEGAPLAGLDLLVVDDELESRDVVCRLLMRAGGQVQTAGSAGEALKLIAQKRPHVLISDVGMPGEDGYSLIRKIRKLRSEEGGDLPAIALTALARLEDRGQALASGFQVHLSKPVEPAELVSAVAMLANRVS